MIAVATTGCGAGADGDGGSSLTEERAYQLECTIDTLTLEIPIVARFELDRPFSIAGETALTFSAVVTLDEGTAAALIDAGVDTIDIISVDVGAWVSGALPVSVATIFDEAPINDFDLAPDTDQNGTSGPHALELDARTMTSATQTDATEVELGIRLDQVSLVLGDFHIPNDCENPTLAGPSARFRVEG
jgi:hypothetical protein